MRLYDAKFNLCDNIRSKKDKIELNIFYACCFNVFEKKKPAIMA